MLTFASLNSFSVPETVLVTNPENDAGTASPLCISPFLTVNVFLLFVSGEVIMLLSAAMTFSVPHHWLQPNDTVTSLATGRVPSCFRTVVIANCWPAGTLCGSASSKLTSTPFASDSAFSGRTFCTCCLAYHSVGFVANRYTSLTDLYTARYATSTGPFTWSMTW